MAVDTEFTTTLLDNLKLDDLWLPPSSWESIHSESGPPQSSSSSSSPCLNHVSSLSEASLVRLAMNALQGVESSLLSIKKISAAFCSDPADRTFHRIPSLWSRCSSTHAQAKILNSIGYFGFMVLLIRKFVEYFTNPNVDDISMGMRQHKYSEVGQSQNHNDDDIREEHRPPYSLTNHAYAVVVGKVIEGYICSLDTLYASIHLRRSSEIVDKPMQASPEAGCLTSVVYSEITLLELYLHTKELRTHIEALGNICNLQNIAICFSESSFECLIAKALFEFQNFCRGGDLLTYLYTQLQVADPSHCALLKFIFRRSCEPYYRFIRSWIFKAEINDPYKEFIVEYLENPPPDQPGRAGISADFHLATIRERDGVAIPCFLKDFVTPLKRVGQQLQVLVKLLELCTYVTSGDDNYENCLPCWSGFSGNNQSNSFSMTFSREDIEAMVILRDSYYKKMKEKLENLLTKLEFGHHQVVSHDRLLNVFGNSGRISNATVYFKSDDCLIGHSREDRKELNVVCDVDSDNSSTTDDLLYEINTLGSSECLSNNTEEQIESQSLIELPSHILLEQKYLSALSFSMNHTLDESLVRHFEGEESCLIKGYPCDTSEKRGAPCNKVQSHQNEMILSQTLMNLESQESNWLGMTHREYTDNIPSDNQSLSKSIFVVDDIYDNDSRSYPLGQPKSSHPVYSKPKVGQMRDLEDGFSDYSKVIMTKNVFLEVLSKDQSKNNIHPSAVSTLQEWKFNPSTNFLSKNPMLLRNAFHRQPTDTEDRGCFDCRQNFPYFDLSSVRDPSKVFMEKFSACDMVSGGSDAGTKSATYDKQFHDQDNLLDGNSRRFDANASSISDLGHNQEDAVLTLACGGNSWESVLGRSNNNVFNSAEDHGHSSLGKFEMPLEFIIDKCLLQEIMLQYDYVSKLTIKLLEEGFDLQEHLLALRRYHFMESADWADLFILSLWNNKWCINEADQRLPEIQGILESSVQRSSCEYDQNKDRLYVYMKEHLAMPLSISATGVQSFNFIGLGYRVDWPVSIVLTPKALKVYAEIFSFLLQMKLSIFSLTDIWRSLKELRYLIRKNHQNELQEKEVGHFYLLVKLRHQVNHFVSTLQQYVESQLSHVSWCRFLDSLQHKVKDMMDFESVHMAYLLDSLRICFLSDETHIIASIIGSILQCALDFRTSLIGGIFNVGTGQDMSGRLSRINISQLLAIKQTFDKNLHELHLCYLKSPKHAEFGLSKFWGYLNYNEYYSNVGNEIGYYAFSI